MSARDFLRRSRALRTGFTPPTRRRPATAISNPVTRPCVVRHRSVDVAVLAERSAARLAHQSGGLGVPGSNPGAPTNKIRHFSQLHVPRNSAGYAWGTFETADLRLGDGGGHPLRKTRPEPSYGPPLLS